MMLQSSNRVLKSCAALIALMGMVGSASAAVVVFVKKATDAKGVVEYHYQYTCVNRTSGTLMVTAENDTKAQQLAETKAKRVCEE